MKRFEESDSILQDFVLNILEEKTNGYYVELGAWHSKQASNTYILEKKFNWKGIALDIVKSRVDEYNQNRTNPCILHDASTFNYIEYFENNNFPKQIDFLQIDVDDIPQNISLLTLLNLPLSTYRFSIIAFEHGAGMSYKEQFVKDMSEKIFDMYGYIRIVKGGIEDWWVDPYSTNSNIYKRFYAEEIMLNPYLLNNEESWNEPFKLGLYPIDKPLH